MEKVDVPEVRKQIRELVRADFQLVPPGYSRQWQIDLGFAKNFLKGKPLQLRIKFNSAQKSTSGTFLAYWQVGEPGKTKYWQTSLPMSLAPDTFHEFEIPPDLFDSQGVLTILFVNPNETSLLFPLGEGMEVLYPEGGFALNYTRGLGIIFCWMAVLAALGLMAASFLTFPVAAFFSLAMLMLVLSSGTLARRWNPARSPAAIRRRGSWAIRRGHGVDPDVQGRFSPLTRLMKNFSPIDALSSGRSHYLDASLGLGVRANRVTARWFASLHHRHRAVQPS